MQIEMPLSIPNTLSVQALASHGCVATTCEEVQQAIQFAREHNKKFVPLGAGSNILPMSMVDAFVCLVRISGIEMCQNTANEVRVRVGAGENWHNFVQFCLQQGWYGLENLSLIPGSVGAAPVQNIGAYGVEVASYIDTVVVLDANGDRAELDKQACEFTYRNSVFKEKLGRTIVEVSFVLSKHPHVICDYPDLQAELTHRHQQSPTPEQVAQAVIAIRQRKLPDPERDPNAGSFFKNPVVPAELAQALLQRFSSFTSFAVSASSVKLSAAQLIDQAGWKSTPAATVACWPKQPLVLYNTHQASGAQILEFAEAIQADVLGKFGIQLELEPSLLS